MKGNGLASCLIEHCPNSARLRSPVCASCSAAFHRAEVKGAAWIIQRQNTLEKWQDRMEYVGSKERSPTRSMKNAARFISRRRA